MLWLALYAASIVLANVMLLVFGLWPVGFGLMAPAGVYAAGLSFWLRDRVHDRYGAPVAVLAVILGAGVSALLSPGLAVASGVAFLVSELADTLVYAPIRERHPVAAVALSNVVGSAVDSALFLLLAFGSLDFLVGQVVGKWWTVLPVMVGMWLARRRRDLSVAAVG